MKIVRFDLGLGVDGDLVYVSISTAHYKAIRQSADRSAWIAAVTEKLRIALAYAATGTHFEWDTLGADDWPDPAPEAYELEPHGLWFESTPPDWPDPPDAGAPYEDLKRYLNVRFWAETYLQYDEDFNIPAELRLTHADAWALAAKAYDNRHRWSSA